MEESKEYMTNKLNDETADRLRELQFMRDLFRDKLPVGPKTGEIEEYFNRLEKVIFTKSEPIKDDEFLPDAVDSDNRPVTYKYYSQTTFKERSKHKPELNAIESDMDDSKNPDSCGPTVQGQSEATQDL